jgi:hypothetical protein
MTGNLAADLWPPVNSIGAKIAIPMINSPLALRSGRERREHLVPASASLFSVAPSA